MWNVSLKDFFKKTCDSVFSGICLLSAYQEYDLKV